MNFRDVEKVTDFKFFWVVVVVILLITFMFFRQKKKKDRKSEKKVEEIFAKLERDYHVFRDIVIPSQGGMCHIDFVVVSPYCIFVIDVRDEGGTVAGELNAREWTLGKNKTIYNPIWRNRLHMNGLEDQLGKVKMRSIVVFTNSRIKGELGDDVVNVEEMEKVIKSRGVNMISPEQLDFAKKVLKSLRE